MANKKKHNFDSAIRSLSKKQDLRIIGTNIFILNGKGKKKKKQNDLGLGSWGKIDFLRKFGFRTIFVPEF